MNSKQCYYSFIPNCMYYSITGGHAYISYEIIKLNRFITYQGTYAELNLARLRPKRWICLWPSIVILLQKFSHCCLFIALNFFQKLDHKNDWPFCIGLMTPSPFSACYVEFHDHNFPMISWTFDCQSLTR